MGCHSLLLIKAAAAAAAAAAKSLQLCPTLCDPIDGSTPGSPIPGILQARVLEWVASSFSIPIARYANMQTAFEHFSYILLFSSCV